LDLALEYLLDRLENAGIADKTVIVMASDHTPYGLPKDQYFEMMGQEEDFFGWYKSNLVFWVGGMEDKVVGADGTIKTVKKELYLAENDRALPKSSRRLARTERLIAEDEAGHADAVRAEVIATLEKLYIQALKEDRVVDAEYYKANLKSLYPDWEFKVKEDNNGDGKKK
jgi:hypothetical protein